MESDRYGGGYVTKNGENTSPVVTFPIHPGAMVVSYTIHSCDIRIFTIYELSWEPRCIAVVIFNFKLKKTKYILVINNELEFSREKPLFLIKYNTILA